LAGKSHFSWTQLQLLLPAYRCGHLNPVPPIDVMGPRPLPSLPVGPMANLTPPSRRSSPVQVFAEAEAFRLPPWSLFRPPRLHPSTPSTCTPAHTHAHLLACRPHGCRWPRCWACQSRRWQPSRRAWWRSRAQCHQSYCPRRTLRRRNRGPHLRPTCLPTTRRGGCSGLGFRV